MAVSEVDSARIELHNETVLTVSHCQSENISLSGSEDGRVMLWRSGEELVASLTPLPGESVNCVTFNPRDTAKFYVASDSSIFVYDTRSLGEVYEVYEGKHEDEINQLATDEKGQYLLSCDDNGEVMCFDIKKRGEVVSRYTVHDNICASVQWVPSRTAEIVSGGMDCKIHHRDLYRQKPMNTILEATNQQGVHVINPPFVNSLSTNWKSRYLVAGYGSGAVKVWRLGSKKVGYVPFRTLPSHSAGTGCVCLVDPVTVVTGGNDGFVHITGLECGASNGHSPSSPHSATPEDTEDHHHHGTVTETGVFKLFHGSKINWLCAGQHHATSFDVLIADETSVITRYTVR